MYDKSILLCNNLAYAYFYFILLSLLGKVRNDLDKTNKYNFVQYSLDKFL